MAVRQIQVLGLCRWSYPSQPGAFKWDGETFEDLLTQIYDPDRLAMRLLFLEHVWLPSVRSQIDKDFEIVMLMGNDLPVGPEVEALIKDVPQIKPVYMPTGRNHREVCNEVMIAHRDPDAKVIAEFRLDDDDAVASEFVAMARSEFLKFRPMFYDATRVALDFTSGFVLDAGEDVTVTPVDARCWVPGTVQYCRPHNPHSLLDIPHLDIWKRMPVMSDGRVPMFVRGSHADNDSNLQRRLRESDGDQASDEEISTILQVRFGIDMPMLRSAWKKHRAGLAGRS